MKKLMIVAAPSLVICVGAAPWVFDRFVVERWSREAMATNPAWGSGKLYQHLTAFEGDVAALRPKLAFLDRPRESDAGPLLNPRLPWTAGGDERAKIDAYLVPASSDAQKSLSAVSASSEARSPAEPR